MIDQKTAPYAALILRLTICGLLRSCPLRQVHFETNKPVVGKPSESWIP
jgi:hypothetical protein